MTQRSERGVAYDRQLAERIGDALSEMPDVIERAMFGGLAFLIDGHMTVVANSKGGLMVRVDPMAAAGLVGTTEAEFAEMRGRQMRGWLVLPSSAVDAESELRAWIDRGVSYAATLPAKR